MRHLLTSAAMILVAILFTFAVSTLLEHSTAARGAHAGSQDNWQPPQPVEAWGVRKPY